MLNIKLARFYLDVFLNIGCFSIAGGGSKRGLDCEEKFEHDFDLVCLNKLRFANSTGRCSRG